MTVFSNKTQTGKLVLEMINFQVGDKFGRDLELVVTEIVGAVKEGIRGKGIQKLEAVRQLENLVFKRLKMRISVETNLMLAAIMPLYSNQHHIFLEKMWHGNVDVEDQVKFMKGVSGKTGTVDMANAVLGGFFSDYVHTVYMNFELLVNDYKMSPPEIVAILLHELGHGFYACEYSDRYASTNQVLANIVGEMSKDKNKRNASYIYKELTKLNPNTKQEMVDTIAKGERVIPDVGMFTYILETTTHQLENVKYDDTSFENLADNFAVRFGYGAQLTEGLRKLNNVHDENAMKRSTFWSVMFTTIGAIVISLVFFFTGSVGLGIFYGLFGLLMGFVMFATAGEQGHDYTYDDIKFRYKRIRDQLVQQIKLKAFVVRDAHQIVQQVEYMDDLVNKTGQYRSFLDSMMNYIRPANFRAMKSIERQQLLEDLASNNLFVQSLKLQMLASK